MLVKEAGNEGTHSHGDVVCGAGFEDTGWLLGAAFEPVLDRLGCRCQIQRSELGKTEAYSMESDVR